MSIKEEFQNDLAFVVHCNGKLVKEFVGAKKDRKGVVVTKVEQIEVGSFWKFLLLNLAVEKNQGKSVFDELKNWNFDNNVIELYGKARQIGQVLFTMQIGQFLANVL